MNVHGEAKIVALIAEIIAAFDGVSREDGMTLHEADAKVDNATAEERRVARALDVEVRWQDVTDEVIDSDWACTAMFFLDPKGFNYYLPAFLVWVLRNWREKGEDNSVLFHLKNCRFREDIYAQFTNAQSKAIAHFLKFLSDEEKQSRIENGIPYYSEYDDAQTALDAYRCQFL